MVTETLNYREESVEQGSYNKILHSNSNKLVNYEKLDITDKESNISFENEKKKRKLDGANLNGNKRIKPDNDPNDPVIDEVFDWQVYLQKTNSTAVPSTIFKHVIPECICGFQPGMKLEVPNRDYLKTYWLAFVIRKAAPLILVRYEGFDDSKSDFWLNTLSDDIHPVGWCARNKQALKPPKAIQHKESNWYQYLIKNLTGARKAADHLFHKKSHPAHYLCAGQYVEVLDLINPNCYWLARITEAFSGRLSLQYEGVVDKEGELWCYYLNPNIRPVGHGFSNGLTLYPPKGCQNLTQQQISKVVEKLLVLSSRSDNSVFKTLFKGLENLMPHGVYLGMKLEAIHPHDPTSICVASVSRIFDEYMFLVKIDNLISAQDEVIDSFVAYKGSKKVFPVGFCSKNNLNLVQPLGYNGKFTWEAYFKYSKAAPVPSDFFLEEKPLPDSIKVGMKLEAVDQKNLSNICVCTISKIVGTYLWLNIDGDTRTDQIFSYDSHDIFPVGWCERTGHELQWPRPNTLEQKNRISSLRLTATRQTRLEVLRKGKYKANEGKIDIKKDQKKGKTQNYLKGKRGFSRKREKYDSDGNKSEIVDTSIAIVCINRLAEEYNSETSIKKYFHLDAEGRLPAQIVTIDDEDEDTLITNEKCFSTYNESHLDFFSYIRLKPHNLNKKEEDDFNRKVKENDGNQGASIEENSSLHGMDRRSLSNVVAMLRSNRRSNRSQLIEQYKNNSKSDHQSTNQNIEHSSIGSKKSSAVVESIEKNGSDGTRGDPIDLSKTNNKKNSRSLSSVVTLTKENFDCLLNVEDANKVPVQVAQQNTSFPCVSSTPRTSVEDMHTLSNMARSHSGLSEILRNRCNKIRKMCKDLPSNPLIWTKNEVVQFIKNASFQKYANLFYQQDVDGHSLLLLTVQEIHHILGIQLGPAVKIHDYIFTLQELVNDAYLSSKNTKSINSTKN
ncbi:scm-like with four MBT domains protein 1 isoform X1 [Hydra vulgaris]|uniref:scm-like with four MBT domains protein 1 isoform X1 n=1 Tax=Hydra vulgaris TaxID=6087 RepID=UPI001F5F5448|nr:scm-like with four MBT domains protein 1 [Hydra vulgaris]